MTLNARSVTEAKKLSKSPCWPPWKSIDCRRNAFHGERDDKTKVCQGNHLLLLHVNALDTQNNNSWPASKSVSPFIITSSPGPRSEVDLVLGAVTQAPYGSQITGHQQLWFIKFSPLFSSLLCRQQQQQHTTRISNNCNLEPSKVQQPARQATTEGGSEAARQKQTK